MNNKKEEINADNKNSQGELAPLSPSAQIGNGQNSSEREIMLYNNKKKFLYKVTISLS